MFKRQSFNLWLLVLLLQVLALCLFSSSIIYALDADLFSAPQFPGAKILWEDKPLEVNGVSARATHLRCNAASQEIMEFYEDSLGKNGWIRAQENNYPYTSNVDTFTKAGRFMYVAVMSESDLGYCDTYILSSPQPLKFCPALSASLFKKELAEDTPGRDSNDIPRYPGSKRRLNMFSREQGVFMVYESDGKINDIANFYRTSFKMMGWKITESLDSNKLKKIYPDMQAGEVRILSFEKAGDSVTVMMNYLNDPQAHNRSLITITKNASDEFNPLPTTREE